MIRTDPMILIVNMILTNIVWRVCVGHNTPRSVNHKISTTTSKSMIKIHSEGNVLSAV